MKNKVLLLLCGLAPGCGLEPLPEYRALPDAESAVVVPRAAYVSRTATTLLFEADIAVLKSYYTGLNYNLLEAQHFSASGDRGSYTISAFEQIARPAFTRPSQVLLLIDQSGTYTELDPYNVRTPAALKFLEDVGAGFLAGGAARNGNLRSEPLELWSPGEDGAGGVADYLFALSRRTGGESAVLDACSSAIGRLAQGTGGKHVVLLTHGVAVSGTTTPQAVWQYANSAGGTIHVVSLGPGTTGGVLSDLALNTGGLYAACETDRQLIKVFSELDRLIHETSSVYRMRILVSSPEGIARGTEVTTRVVVEDRAAGEYYGSAYIKIRVP